MRAKFTRTGPELNFNSGVGSTLAERIAALIGDPAYLYEFSDLVGPASRKQLEIALRSLCSAGRLVRYGTKNRRLYATAREVHPALEGLPADSIRTLQLFPHDGALLNLQIERGSDPARQEAAFGNATLSLRALHEAGLIISACSRPRVHMLTAIGMQASANLGSGLRLPALSPSETLEAINTGRASILAAIRKGGASINDVSASTALDYKQAHKAVLRLRDKGLLARDSFGWKLTSAGRREDKDTLAIEIAVREMRLAA